MHRSIAALVFGLGLFVAACGSSTGDRTLSGAGIGTIVGAVTGLSLLEGALIGAAAGGLTGALTTENAGAIIPH